MRSSDGVAPQRCQLQIISTRHVSTKGGSQAVVVAVAVVTPLFCSCTQSNDGRGDRAAQGVRRVREGLGQVRDRLRAGVGHRHRAHGLPRAGARGALRSVLQTFVDCSVVCNIALRHASWKFIWNRHASFPVNQHVTRCVDLVLLKLSFLGRCGVYRRFCCCVCDRDGQVLCLHNVASRDVGSALIRLT